MLARAETTSSLPLFEKYGGLRTLRAVIIDFYDRVLDSDVVGHFFEDVDIAKLIDHQTKFFTACLLYTSPSPRDQRGSRMPSSA